MWKSIRQFPKLEINEKGEIRNIKTKTSKAIHNTAAGYPQIRVQEKYKRKYYYVHRLVYETFIGEIPEGKEINHIDGNKNNSALNNL